MGPKYRPGQIVTPNRAIPRRSPYRRGQVAHLEPTHHFKVRRVKDAGGGIFDVDLEDAQGTVWRDVPEVALDPVESEGHEADPGGAPPAGGTGTLFD